MKNIYIKSINNNLKYLVLFIAFLIGNAFTTTAQVRVNFTQRTSQYTPTKKIYNVKGDFAMLGNTNLTPQNYGVNTNNNGQYMQYVDIDNDPNTLNSSSSTLALSTENGAIPSCSNIVYAGLYWTGKSSASNTFTVTKDVPNGTQAINNNLTIAHNQNIANTNYSLSITRNNPNPNNSNTSPIYTFSGNGNTYVFNYTNNAAPAKVTLSVNGGLAANIPVTVVVSGTNATATLTTPYSITDGTVTLKINNLVRSTAINLNSGNTQNTSTALVNVSGTIPVILTITKNYDKRVISLKGPNSTSYTQFTAAATDIYYPNGIDDDIYSAHKEITDYVKTNGIGEYFAADIALLQGDPGGTGYSGGWGIIVVYENSKMKYRDVTIFDGYAYVNSSNSTGFTLPVSGFNTVQSGNVGVKLGIMASEGDVAYTGDYFQIQKKSDASYLSLNHSLNSTTNFFNSSINTGGGFRNPSLQNNTGIDISMFNVPNTGNTVIGNSQTSTNFKYGTSGDTYSIFAIAMAVDAYIPEVEGLISATTINNVPVATQPFSTLPGQEIGFNVDVKNLGTEAINNYKVIIPIPYNATYVAGSAIVSVLFTPLPTPNNIYFDPALGITGSIVWDFGKLPLPSNPSTLLAKLNFKIKATIDCQILSNSSCGSAIVVDGISTGAGATTGIIFNGTKFIQGYTQNGTCIGQPIAQSLTIGIDSANYVATYCQNTPLVRNFSYCNGSSLVSPSEITSNFPNGSLFYDSFPVTTSSIQYTASNPFPLVDGSTATYYALPPSSNPGCNFPFTISKCKKILANDDAGIAVNGLTGGTSFTNVLINDTLNGVTVTPAQVKLTFVSSTNASVTLSGSDVVVAPGTPEGNYTLSYQICEVGNLSNCDTAIVTVPVSKAQIIANNDTIDGGNGTTGNPNAGNVLANNGNGPDSLNGNPITIDQVNLTITTPATAINGNPVPAINPSSGQISIPTGTPAGTYTIIYQICEKLNPTNCDSATVTITSAAPIIDAVDNSYSSQCSLNVSLGSVLNNDTLNLLTVNPSDVIITLVSGDNPNVSFNTTTGAVSIISGLAVGQYILVYKICQAINLNNCDTANIVINITDTTKPIAPVLADVIGQCSATATTPTTTDNCSGTVTGTTADSLTYNTQGTHIITWTFNDGNGNSITATQNVIITDTTKPIAPVLADVIGQCSATATTPTTTDNCSGTVTGTTADSLTYNTQGTHIITWTFNDGNGNSITATQNVILADNISPIPPLAPANLIVDCAINVPTTIALTATDNCSGIITTLGVDSIVQGNCPNSFVITRIWTFTDASNNSSSISQTINVQDITAPVIAALPAPSTISCPATPVFAVATATDGCGSAFTLTSADVTTPGVCAGSYSVTRTWTAKDGCNNS
ncbi:beta strand repeat-containing protein, partial [Flavobacterium psychrotolerans]